MKKQVLMIGPALSVKGGMSSVAIAIIDNLSDEFEIQFLPAYVEGGKFRAGFAFLSAMLKLKDLARKSDVVHIHFSKKGSTLRKAALARIVKRVGTPLLLHSHADSYDFYDKLPEYGKWRVREFLGSANRFIVLSESWGEHYAEKGARNITVLPNPVVIPDDVADRSGRETVTTVFIGEMGDRKGAFDLAEAFIPVAKSRPNARLIMAGNGEVERVRDIFREGEVIDQTEIYDWVGPDERDQLLRRADVFILPSYSEGLPMAMLEAIGFGLPPIVTPVGGIPEVIKDGVNGLLVKPGDKEAIAAAITRLVDNTELRAAMGVAARRTAEDYDIKKYMKTIEGLYRELASNKAS